MSKKTTVAFQTLGCKLNFSETSAIARDFEKKGYRKVNFNDKADIYVINTCTVTNNADKKCRNTIKKAVKNSPDAIIAVIGCYSQIKPNEIIKIPGVDLVLGGKDKFKIIEHIENFDKQEDAKIYSCDIDKVEQFVSSYSLGDRTRSFLKVQDGCNYGCAYCTIPLARGKSRNNNIAQTIQQAKEIAATDVNEIVLTGINIGDFGRSTDENFYDLIREMDKIEGIERFRISSIEPNLIDDEIIEFVAHSQKFVPHFHLPLQSGCNKILKLMLRRYKREVFAERVSKMKSIIPNVCIGADVIVGFPNETEEDFWDTYNFIKELDISYLHVFSYSERPNTKAIDIPNKISKQEKNKRSKLLHQLSDEKKQHFYQQNLGKETTVLFEHPNIEGKMSGFSDNYVRVEIPYDQQYDNKIVKVKLDSLCDNGNFNGIIL